jgi:hypothetical protein
MDKALSLISYVDIAIYVACAVAIVRRFRGSPGAVLGGIAFGVWAAAETASDVLSALHIGWGQYWPTYTVFYMAATVCLLAALITGRVHSQAQGPGCSIGTANDVRGGGQMGKSRWSWSFARGIGWALGAGAGALFGAKFLLVRAAVSGGSYSPPLFLVFGVAGLALWLGGLRRISKRTDEQEASIRERVADMKKPKDNQG